MTLSAKLNKELNNEFNPVKKILQKHIYGTNKRRKELKMQAKVKKMIEAI